MTTHYIYSGASTSWAASTVYALGDRVVGSAVTTVVFECTTAGTSGATEPVWDVTPGNTTVDGTATWTARSFDSWLNAAPQFQWALTAWLPGDAVWMASDHSETFAASTTFTAPSATRADPVPIYSIDRTTNTYALSATPQLSSVGGAYSLLFGLPSRLYGLNISAGGNVDPQQINGDTVFTDCALESQLANGGLVSGYGNSNCATRLIGCSLNLSSITGGGIKSQAQHFEMRGGNIIGYASAINGLVRINPSRFAVIDLIGVDIAAVTFNGGLVAVSGDGGGLVRFIDCAIPGGVQIWNTAPSGPDQVVEVHSSDSAGALYRHERHDFYGSVVFDAANYRDAGYQDASDATPISHCMTPDTPCSFIDPLEGFPIFGYVGATGTKTFTVEVAHNFAAALTEAEAWLEVCALGTVGSTQWSLVSNRVMPMDTPVAQASSAEAWTGVNAVTKQRLSVTMTVNKAGPFMARVNLAKYAAASYLYYDPICTVA